MAPVYSKPLATNQVAKWIRSHVSSFPELYRFVPLTTRTKGKDSRVALAWQTLALNNTHGSRIICERSSYAKSDSIIDTLSARAIQTKKTQQSS
jgi:hypothetical protein